MLSLPASRTELVLTEIRRAILARELLPGQPLVEMELAQRLGVSKTPVREALKILSGSGLVTFSPYKGASVSVVSRELASSVYEVRLLIEPEAVRLAVRNAVKDGDTSGFDEAAEILAKASTLIASGGDDHAELSLLNRTFHQALYAGCGNPILINILDGLRDRAALISVTGWDATRSWAREWEEHRAVLAAARRGDTGAAADKLRKHIQGFLKRTLATIGG